MSVAIFLSAVSDEFRAYRDQLRTDLTRHNVETKVQEDFKDLGDGTLDKLDVYIQHCDAVVHLIGDMTGALPGEQETAALLAKHPDFMDKLPVFAEALSNGVGVSYTQWEAWLALYHGDLLLIAKADDSAERGPKYVPTDASLISQAAHLTWLETMNRYSGCTFTGPADLAKHIAYTVILDLLVKAYAEELAHARDVAEGFIREVAEKVTSDLDLDFEGKKQAIRNAVDLYVKEVAGGLPLTNFGPVVDEALTNARILSVSGKSGLARAALRKVAEAMRSNENERRERYIASVTALFNSERDIALAAYDGEAAAGAIIALGEAVHRGNSALVKQALNSEAAKLYRHGRDFGSNVHLVALIALNRKMVRLADSYDEHVSAKNRLGVALMTLGERESGAEKLREAVEIFRETLREKTREHKPLQWARAQNNLGEALAMLGERESGMEKLEEAAAAFREALKEFSRESVPVEWARAQNNLGNVLVRLWDRESGTGRQEEMGIAFRGMLNQLTLALKKCGEPDSGTVKVQDALNTCREVAKRYASNNIPFGDPGSRKEGLEEAVTAYQEALKETTRERMPVEWAGMQNNLGNVLSMLGDMEGNTGKLEKAIEAFREALKEKTRERVPLKWAGTQHNLAIALWRLGELEGGRRRLEEAVEACHEALQERTREGVPLQWAATQNNLGIALMTLGERESGTEKLEEAMDAYCEALKEWTQESTSHWHNLCILNMVRCLALLIQRSLQNLVSKNLK